VKILGGNSQWYYLDHLLGIWVLLYTMQSLMEFQDRHHRTLPSDHIPLGQRFVLIGPFPSLIMLSGPFTFATLAPFALEVGLLRTGGGVGNDIGCIA
jgi:hypothetical protein